MKYDYIIAGSGCAGLSLLFQLLQDPSLKKKKILLIDQELKVKNDRTWCFWEKDPGVFEEIVHHQWNNLKFITPDFCRTFELEKFTYKMIKGIDMYTHVLDYAKNFDHVTFKHESIGSIKIEENLACVETSAGKYYAQYVFNSTSLFNPEINSKNSLLQHFKGWVIRTKNPSFDSEVGTLMDFRLSQENGATFMYVLPTSSHEALIEYTLFSEKTLAHESYEHALRMYIKDYLKIDEYELIHEEYGVIPMTTAKFSRHLNQQRIINIGTAGGYTKASSGYTFQFIQKNTKAIVKNLKNNSLPLSTLTFRDRLFEWYDRTLIEVILSKRVEGRAIFSRMFKKLNPEEILTFLDNESSLLDDIKLMSCLPIKPFLMSGIKQLKTPVLLFLLFLS